PPPPRRAGRRRPRACPTLRLAGRRPGGAAGVRGGDRGGPARRGGVGRGRRSQLMDPPHVVLTVALTLFVLILAASCLLRANRLDRLHVRTDAARAALLAALERRAVVARAVAVPLGEETLRSVASRAEAARATERETEENELSRLLA